MNLFFSTLFWIHVGAFDCDPALREVQALYQNAQYLLTYNLATEIEFNCGGSLHERGRYARMLSLYQLGENREALRLGQQTWSRPNYREKAQIFSNLFLIDDSQFLDEGWLQRKRVWIARNDFKKALGLLETENISKIERQSLSLLLKQIQDSQRHPPLTIASLSLIPGLGQTVMGDYSSAALSLLLNGLFGYASYEFFDRKMYAASGISATVFSITYIGGMVQAGRLAKAKNEYESQPHQETLRRELFGKILDP